MKRIRIGKDISMRWEITTDGVAIPLEGRDLTVEIKSPSGIENNIPYRVDGNILIMTYYGYEQKRTGEYSITLWEKKGKPGQNVVDVIRAFELVRTSQEENDFVGGDLQVESVDLGTENFDILTEGGYRAINIDTLQVEALEDSVNINGKTYSNESFTITLPKANLDSAGVMGASDVRTLNEHAASIINLNTDVSKLKDKDIETYSSLSELTTRVDTLKSQSDTNTSNISSINTEVSALQSKVAENTTSISQINTELNNKNDEIAQINTTLEEHTESINTKITTDRIEDGAVTIGKLEPSIQSLIANISKNATFAGIATPTTNPGTPDGPVFYIANGKGIYANFGGIDVTEDEVVILYYDTIWHKNATGIASNDKLTDLEQIKDELHGTTQYNIIVTFNNRYEYQTIDKINAGTKIKNNTNNGYHLYDKTEGTMVGSLLANSSVVLEADITSIRIMGNLPVTPFEASFTIGETKEGFIEKTNKNDATQNAELEVLNKDIYEVIYNKHLSHYEFYGSETEPLSHIIRKGSVVKNNSEKNVIIYNSDKSIEIRIKPQEIITTDFDIYFLRNSDTPQTINVSVASALDSSLFRENAIKKLVLGYRINLNLSEYQYYPNEDKASNILVNKDVNVKNNGTYAVTLHNLNDSQYVKIEPGKRVRVPFDVFYIRNYSSYTVDVSLEIEGLPSVEERVKVLEENPSSSFDSIVVNVSESTGIPSGSASLDNGVLTFQLNNIKGERGPKGDKGDTGERGPKGDKGDTGERGPKGDKGDTGERGPKGDKGDTGERGPKGDKGDTGERGNDGAQGIQGNSGVASSDGIESIQDLSQDIPNDTTERVYVAGAKVVKDKIEHLYRDKAPYSQFYGNGNTAKNINGGRGKSVIIGDDNGMYATNDANCNTLVGYHADYGLTTGHSNTAIGCEALDRNRSGHDNVAVGMFAVGCNSLNGEDPTTYKSCTYNVGVGSYALHHNGGVGNTAIGNFSSQSLDDDDTSNSNGNTAVGNYSLAYNKRGSYNVCIGNAAGKYSQGSLELYIDAVDRGDDSRNNPENITKGRTKSLVYGKFNGSPSSQEFHINAGLIVMPYLPSNDPHVSGALWNDSGILKISNG